MSDLATEQAETPDLSLEAAELVAKHVQIRGVFLAESMVRRSHQVLLDEEGFALTHTVTDVEFGVDRDKSEFFVKVSLALLPIKDGKPEQPPRMIIGASFVLLYTLDSFDGIEDSHILSFAGINAVYNAWPYWREFVHSMTSRMGVQAVIAPVHRIGPDAMNR